MTEDLPLDATAEEYLSEIERAAAALPANRRAELLADVRSHIVVAQAEAASGSPAGIEDPAVMSQILSKLGDPEAIVAAAVADLPPETQVNSTARTASSVLVRIAVILLLIGGLGWCVLYLLFQPGHAGGGTRHQPSYSPRPRFHGAHRGGPTMIWPWASAAAASTSLEIVKPSGLGVDRSRPPWRNMFSMPPGVAISSRSARSEVMR